MWLGSIFKKRMIYLFIYLQHLLSVYLFSYQQAQTKYDSDMCRHAKTVKLMGWKILL